LLEVYSIEELAEKTGNSFGHVKQDLQIMINEKFLDPALISHFSEQMDMNQLTAQQQLAVSVELLCEACGAKAITTQGAKIICEYCGSLNG